MKNNFLKLLISFNLFIVSFLIFTYSQPKKLNLSGEYDFEKSSAYFHGQKLDFPEFDDQELPISYDSEARVLGDTAGEKKIFIDLTNQRLYAFQGNRHVYSFPVSTGKWGRTPTGRFRIWVKLRYTKMSGGSRALNTYYYLPNVPYVMYFYNSAVPSHRGFGIHGTYWHNNFGHPMSHGCINMKTEEAGKLYYWANPRLEGRQSIYAAENNPGTEVIIFGKAPN